MFTQPKSQSHCKSMDDDNSSKVYKDAKINMDIDIRDDINDNCITIRITAMVLLLKLKTVILIIMVIRTMFEIIRKK